MLVEALQRYPVFQTLPLDKQHALTTLALKFEESEHALYLSPRELSQALKIGSPDIWALLLSLEPTKNYIKKEMADRTQIASRKAFQSLSVSAASGSVQAAKEINELSGIFEKTDNNKIVILHRVNRPQIQTEGETNK